MDDKREEYHERKGHAEGLGISSEGAAQTCHETRAADHSKYGIRSPNKALEGGARPKIQRSFYVPFRDLNQGKSKEVFNEEWTDRVGVGAEQKQGVHHISAPSYNFKLGENSSLPTTRPEGQGQFLHSDNYDYEGRRNSNKQSTIDKIRGKNLFLDWKVEKRNALDL